MEYWQALAIAGSAGFVNYIQRFAVEVRPPWVWASCGVKVITGSAAGLVGSWVIPKKLGLELEQIYFLIWIAGWGGPVFFDFAMEVTKDAARTVFAGAAKRLSDKAVVESDEKEQRKGG